MTIFRLKQLASTSFHAAADAMQWNYDRAELIADGVVHIVGVCLGLVAATALIVLTAVYASAFEVAVVSVYVAGLLAMLTFSAVYNLWPVSRAKWVLRRFDSFGDLSLDRRDLYPVHRGAAGELSRDRVADRGVVRRDRRRGAEAGAAGAVRSSGRRPLSGVGLERRDARDAVMKAVPPLALGLVVAGGRAL